MAATCNDVDDDVPSSSSNSCVFSSVGVVGLESIGGDPTNELVSKVSVSAKSPSWLVAAWINADSPLYAVDILEVICDADADADVDVDVDVDMMDWCQRVPCSTTWRCLALICSLLFRSVPDSSVSMQVNKTGLD